jgi:5-methylcytosine-specific restriction endonuclease McrA
MPRLCLRTPILEIEIAATHLNNAVTAHLNNDRQTAEDLLHLANNKTIWLWTESVWGKQTPYNTPRQITPNPPVLPPSERAKPRDATPETKRQIHERDGHYCRFCKIPVIRPAIRTAIHKQYPTAVPWGPSNTTQHAAFQCLWAQYDHIIPHARGGQSTLENMVLTCAACNYGRGNYLLEDFNLIHPNLHPPRTGPWDGLNRFR